MKANETGSKQGRQLSPANHRAAKFSKVLDGRKQRIRGLWKRGDRYYAQLVVEDPATGTRQTKRIPLLEKDGVTAVSTQPQAIAALERLKVKRVDGELPTLHRCPKLAAYVDTYLEFIKAGQGQKRASSIAKDEAILRRWVDHMGHLRLDQIRPAHLSTFIKHRLEKNWSPRTINLDVISLRCCLKQARQDGWISKLPTEGLKPLKVSTPRRPFFAQADIERICTAAMATKDGAPVTKNGKQLVDYLRLLSYSGARRNEALRLRWCDVDFVGRRLTIGAAGDAKNHQARTVDFNPRLEEHLKDMHSRRAPDCDFIFPSPQRGAKNLSAKSFMESLKLARAHAGLSNFTFHDCRHTFISLAVMAGVDFMTIAKWAGHQDGGVLIGKVYGHLANEHRQAMAAKLTFEPTIVTTASEATA